MKITENSNILFKRIEFEENEQVTVFVTVPVGTYVGEWEGDTSIIGWTYSYFLERDEETLGVLLIRGGTFYAVKQDDVRFLRKDDTITFEQWFEDYLLSHLKSKGPLVAFLEKGNETLIERLSEILVAKSYSVQRVNPFEEV